MLRCSVPLLLQSCGIVLFKSAQDLLHIPGSRPSFSRTNTVRELVMAEVGDKKAARRPSYFWQHDSIPGPFLIPKNVSLVPSTSQGFRYFPQKKLTYGPKRSFRDYPTRVKVASVDVIRDSKQPEQATLGYRSKPRVVPSEHPSPPK